MARNVVLEVVSGPNRGKTIEVPSGQTIMVGRHAGADLAIREDAMMSNVHFALEWDGPHCRLRDLKSRFGTTLNQQKVAASVLQDGDRITAGNTTFVVRIIGATVSSEAKSAPAAILPPVVDAVPKTAVAKPPSLALDNLAALHEGVLHELRQQPEPLYALLDAARDPLVLARLLNSGEEYQSLYEGPQGEAMADFGPYLVKLPKQSRFLETLVREGWGNSWGLYLTCEQSFKEVRKHLRHFLTVQLPDGDQVFFRFYDPRVLRVFLETLNREEATTFFGTITRFLMEADEPRQLLKCSHPEKIGKAVRNW